MATFALSPVASHGTGPVDPPGQADSAPYRGRRTHGPQQAPGGIMQTGAARDEAIVMERIQVTKRPRPPRRPDPPDLRTPSGRRMPY